MLDRGYLIEMGPKLEPEFRRIERKIDETVKERARKDIKNWEEWKKCLGGEKE